MWHKELQIAIVEKDTQKISQLIAQMPHFDEVEQMQQAASLIKEALKLVHALKDETAKSMQKLKQHRDFLKATSTDKSMKFDVTF